MGILTHTALAARITPQKPRAAVNAIVQRGVRACLRARNLFRKQASPRNPIVRLQPRRATRLSPCGRWFVIAPLQAPTPATTKEPFQARHAIEMGRLSMPRSTPGQDNHHDR
jgi:hypothetical protein